MKKLSLLMLVIFTPVEAQNLRPPSGAPPVAAISMEPASVKDLTEPNQSFSCDTLDLVGETHNFQLRYHGRRGYLEPETGEARQTDGSVTVAKDPSNVFSGYSNWTYFPTRFHAEAARANATFGPRLRLDLQRTDFEREAVIRTRWAILVQTYFGSFPLTKAVGFCWVESVAQQPLSTVESRRYLSGR